MKCNIRGIEINYEVLSEGRPILCIHGYGEDLEMMKGCLEPLSFGLDNYKRIYIDLPGMGKTKVTSQVNNADSMVEILEEFVAKTIGNESFLIASQSYGGYLTLGLLLKISDKIDGVFLLCPCIIAPNQLRTLPSKMIILQEESFCVEDKNNIDKNNKEYFLNYAVRATSEVYDRYKKEILPGLVVGDQKFLEEYQKNGYALSFIERLNNFVYARPTCILTGRQDHCVGYKDAFDILKVFPRGTFSILDLAGHNLQIENKELFESHFIDWINRVEIHSKVNSS